LGHLSELLEGGEEVVGGRLVDSFLGGVVEGGVGAHGVELELVGLGLGVEVLDEVLLERGVEHGADLLAALPDVEGVLVEVLSELVLELLVAEVAETAGVAHFLLQVLLLGLRGQLLERLALGQVPALHVRPPLARGPRFPRLGRDWPLLLRGLDLRLLDVRQLQLVRNRQWSSGRRVRILACVLLPCEVRSLCLTRLRP